jgi:hypothetical protein
VKKQLLLSKRIFFEGCEFAERNDPVSSGLAISLFQDAVEMFVWTLIKERNIPVKENAQFTSNIESLSNAGVKLPFIPKMLELNKSRVGFKHYGNLPAIAEATKFRAYVEEFLRVSFVDQFVQNFDDLSLVDLIAFDDVRSRLKASEQLVKSAQYSDAINEAAIAKGMLFSKLDRFVPKIGNVPMMRGDLESLREAVLAALIRIPLQDYSFIKNALPNASMTMDGEWHINIFRQIKYDEVSCKRAIDCLVALSIRMESIV